jgi:glycosyltransferase involved in cell wall biosynthesis
MRVLYNGWPLAHHPNSPAALHLLTLVSQELPAIEPVVALPAEPVFPLPANVEIIQDRIGETTAARLAWEQHRLLRLAARTRADLIHVVGEGPPVRGKTPVLFSPTRCGWESRSLPGDESIPIRPGLVDRLRSALAEGGQARVRAWLWPADLPPPETRSAVVQLPPAVHPAFIGQSAHLPGFPDDFPEEAVIFHSDGRLASLHEALAAWVWASGPVGQYSPLLLVGLTTAERQAVESYRAQFAAHPAFSTHTIQVAPPLPVESLAALYRGCAAVLHPQPISPWDGPARLALACGVPLVAYENPYSDALVGRAAYLVPENLPPAESRRRLGAALITVVVEESLAEKLKIAAGEQTAGWQMDFNRQLSELYRRF